jgi:hypothetical protein
MLSAQQWHAKFQDAGMMIKGNRLLYQDGVKRKRLPPKHLFMMPSENANQTLVPTTLTEEAIDSELHHATAVEAIDSDLEDVSFTSENRSAELPTRARRFGVGKEIGYAVYVHRDYEEVLGQSVEWAKRHLPEHYEYNVVKLNQRNDSVSFIQCNDFDYEHEPAIAGIIVVNATGQVQRRTMPSDPYIYHHKWLFVADDYQGFDVAASKARSLLWVALGGVDRSRIGRRSYWEENVVPRLMEKSIANVPLAESPSTDEPVETSELWVRSKDACKLLKLSTCELMHARESGKIPFKKIGNAFLYLVDG